MQSVNLTFLFVFHYFNFSPGANGKTFEELHLGLHLSDDKMANANNFHDFGKLLEKSVGQSTLTIANRIYVQNDFDINQQFKEVATQKFASNIEALNFAESDSSASTINKFVKEKTNGRIENLIQPDMLDSLTRMALVNTIYFKGVWKYQFDSHYTCKGSFYINEKDTCSVDFMATNEDFNYCKLVDLDAAALEMKYAGSNLSLVILLPNSRTGLSTLESKLCNFDLTKIIQRMGVQHVMVKIPKFKVEFELNLNDLLQKVFCVNLNDETSSIYNFHSKYFRWAWHRCSITTKPIWLVYRNHRHQVGCMYRILFIKHFSRSMREAVRPALHVRSPNTSFNSNYILI